MGLEIGLLILELFKVLNLARHKDKYFLLANWPRLLVIAKTFTALIPLPITCLLHHRKVYAKKKKNTLQGTLQIWTFPKLINLKEHLIVPYSFTFD